MQLPIRPMLAQKVAAPVGPLADGDRFPLLDRNDLAFEPKYDGYRLVVGVTPIEITLWHRSGRLVTAEYPEIVEALRDAPPGVYDGEVTVKPEVGKSAFNAFQNRGRLSLQERRDRVQLILFDVIEYAGDPVYRGPYFGRRQLLEELIDPIALRVGLRVAVSPSVQVGRAMWNAVLETNGEGVIAKPLTSPYRFGERGTWMKLKALQRELFVVVGFTSGISQGGPTEFGALILAEHTPAGLRYAGKSGTGFTASSSDEVVRRLREVAVDVAPWAGVEKKNALAEIAPGERAITWVMPDYVAEVEFSDRSDAGIPRFPAFKSLRRSGVQALVVA